jgi:SAM-dependent methyltransferase
MIYDVRAALRHLYRILKPGGVVLVTSHGISKVGRREGIDPWGEYWRFTSQSVRRLFEEVFPPANIKVETYGNVLAAITFLHGLAAEELRREELDCFDPDYEVLVTVRAVKP